MKGNNNLFVLKTYPKQINYGSVASLPQTFVDLWNLSDWYAKDFNGIRKENRWLFTMISLPKKLGRTKILNKKINLILIGGWATYLYRET